MKNRHTKSYEGGTTKERIKKASVTKELLQVRHVYRGNANRICVRFQTLLQPEGNDAKPTGQHKQIRGPYVGPNEA